MNYENGDGEVGFVPVEPWETPIHGPGLLDAIRSVIIRYVVCPPHAAEALALWVVHTYAFPLRRVTTYLGVVSPEKRCGKTTLLTVLGALANRAVMASNISPPALFRVIEEAAPTLIIDEADTFLRGRGEMRGILNAGYTRESAYVIRVERRRVNRMTNGNRKMTNSEDGGGPGGMPNDEWRIGSSESGQPGYGIPNAEGEMEVEQRKEPNLWGRPRKAERSVSRIVSFSCWCPKVMAAIGSLPETVTDRCVMITLQRKESSERCERLRDFECLELRRRCVRFVEDHTETIRTLQPQVPPQLNDRAADIWEPLLALAEIAGGDWPKMAREAATALSGWRADKNPVAVLLTYIQFLFRETGSDRLFSRTIVDTANSFEDRPWEDMRHGKILDELWLSRLLRGYGIRPKTIWIGEESARGYFREDFAEAFQRYGPPLPERMKAYLRA